MDNVEDNEFLAGHIDFIIKIENNIYVCDYKPEVDFSMNPDAVSHIFADTIPQISTYALLLELMIKDDLKDGKYKLFAYTFNYQHGIITNPLNALAAYTAFLKEIKSNEFQDGYPWEYLIPKNLINQYSKKINNN
jgi:hypothetical protein